MQIASPYLPYGGLGRSGIGRYHGKTSFETFSNLRSILVKIESSGYLVKISSIFKIQNQNCWLSYE